MTGYSTSYQFDKEKFVYMVNRYYRLNKDVKFGELLCLCIDKDSELHKEVTDTVIQLQESITKHKVLTTLQFIAMNIKIMKNVILGMSVIFLAMILYEKLF